MDQMTPPAGKLFRVTPPRLHVIARPTEQRLRHAWPLMALPTNAVARRARCKKMRTVDGLFDEVSAAFQFPPYFGENWAALEDCLTDLDWIGAGSYLAIFWDAEHLLADATPDDMSIFVRMLDRVAAAWSRPIAAGEAWDRPAVPFHALFVVPQTDMARYSTMLTTAGVANTILAMDA